MHGQPGRPGAAQDLRLLGRTLRVPRAAKGVARFGFDELCEQPLDEREANRLLQATLKGWVLGSDSYREWAGRAANRRVSPLPRGRPRKIRETPQTR